MKQAYEAGIQVTAVPGASAAITALILSGLGTRRFCFEAFLPDDKKERHRILEQLKDEARTTVIYEAPHRLKKTLKELADTLGDRRITIVKELTKKHETIRQTTLTEAVRSYDEEEPKGEYVLVLEGASYEELLVNEREQWNKLGLEEHMNLYLEQGLDKKEAMKAVAKDRGVSKSTIYQMLISEKESKDS